MMPGRSPWLAWTITFAVILALSLAPWPGWGEAWMDCYCEVAGSVADLVPWSPVKTLFRPGDDASQGEERVPWQFYVYMQRVGTADVDRLVQNERLEYVSVATFLALAGASMGRRWKTSRFWKFGLPLLLGALALNDVDRLVLAVDRWRWIALPAPVEVVLSAIYALFNGMPVTPIALPALLWWALVWLEIAPTMGARSVPDA
jgi:hypothetical protein